MQSRGLCFTVQSLSAALVLLPGAVCLLVLACLFLAPVVQSMLSSWWWSVQLSAATVSLEIACLPSITSSSVTTTNLK